MEHQKGREKVREEALLRDDCNRAPNTENEIRAANRKGTRSELVVFLTTNGFPISKSHLDKLCMLGRGRLQSTSGVIATSTTSAVHSSGRTRARAAPPPKRSGRLSVAREPPARNFFVAK